MIGVRTVAEVFRTLDKMALRKEFHKAMAKCGIDFGFIVDGIKTECLGAEKASDRLKGYQILLKSMGMDSYDDKKTEGGGGWEEALQKIVKGENGEGDEEEPLQLETIENDDENIDYEVEQPTMPDSVKIRKQQEIDDGKQLYD